MFITLLTLIRLKHNYIWYWETAGNYFACVEDNGLDTPSQLDGRRLFIHDCMIVST